MEACRLEVGGLEMGVRMLGVEQREGTDGWMMDDG